MTNEAERVLANWISEAMSPDGQLPAGVSVSSWVAGKFLRWWRKDAEGDIEDCLGQAETALAVIRHELELLGGWQKFGEALHECMHLGDALADLREAFSHRKVGSATELGTDAND
jgi:hypothetical protein